MNVVYSLLSMLLKINKEDKFTEDLLKLFLMFVINRVHHFHMLTIDMY